MPITTDYQLDYNGLTMGAGTPWGISKIEGLYDMPELRTADTDRPGADGAFPGMDYYGTRSLTVDFIVTGTSAADLAASTRALMNATVRQASELALTVRTSGGDVFLVWARPRRRTAPIELVHATGHALWVSIQWDATDPRLYDPTQTVVTTGLPVSGGGHGFNHGFNLSFGGTTGTGGVVACTNSGNVDVFPTFTITAGANPLVNPTLQGVESGALLAFGFTLAAGDVLAIDPRARTVILNGTVSRRAYLQVGATWPTLPPGTSTYRFGADLYTSTATLQVAYRSGRI